MIVICIYWEDMQSENYISLERMQSVFWIFLHEWTVLFKRMSGLHSVCETSGTCN